MSVSYVLPERTRDPRGPRANHSLPPARTESALGLAPPSDPPAISPTPNSGEERDSKLETNLGAPQRYGHLTVFPVVAEEERSLRCLLLAHAAATGQIIFQEVDEGNVPTLEVVNKGDTAVLILDGEQLIAARQNRMTSSSLLVAPLSTTNIPVSCMEQGRWPLVSDDLKPSPQDAPTKVRAKARQADAHEAAASSPAH